MTESPALPHRLWGTVRRLPRNGVIWLLRGYQLVVSPMTGPTCRFYPSCSEYAVRAVEVHGLIRGTGYAVWRILRCNPWNFGGIDDVPGTEPCGTPVGEPRQKFVGTK